MGGNPSAAVYAGIDPGRTQFLAFVLSGACAGLTGYLWVARYQVAYVDIAGGFELDVVAACVIGGISIAGGAGTVAGAVLGALFLGIVKNALPVVGVLALLAARDLRHRHRGRGDRQRPRRAPRRPAHPEAGGRPMTDAPSAPGAPRRPRAARHPRPPPLGPPRA